MKKIKKLNTCRIKLMILKTIWILQMKKKIATEKNINNKMIYLEIMKILKDSWNNFKRE